MSTEKKKSLAIRNALVVAFLYVFAAMYVVQTETLNMEARLKVTALFFTCTGLVWGFTKMVESEQS